MIDFSTIKKLSIDNIELRRLLVNDTLVWRDGIFNWVPVSRDTDGSIYNSVGYIEGYRLSSSGALKEQNNSTACGYIPAKTGDTVRLAGMDWSDKGGNIYDYIICYDNAFTKLSTLNSQGYGDGATVSVNEEGIWTFTITMNNTAYIRISATGTGTDMIVTVNEKII